MPSLFHNADFCSITQDGTKVKAGAIFRPWVIFDVGNCERVIFKSGSFAKLHCTTMNDVRHSRLVIFVYNRSELMPTMHMRMKMINIYKLAKMYNGF